MKSWEDYLIDQKILCGKFGIEWVSSEISLKIGLSDEVIKGIMPINGLRHWQEKDTTGWYIWAGEEYSNEDDFFKPHCLKHLITICPLIIQYLGLPAGYRFLIDNKGYEDVWEDKKLLKS
jgi:hypothetical protein